MLSEKMQQALNKQLNCEFYSSYLYLAMAAYFNSAGLAGFAGWMRVQAQEELLHAAKFYDYLSGRGARVELREIGRPPANWRSPLVAFEDAYRHEQGVSRAINELVNLALEEKDHASNNFLQWFVAEQVEEEASFNGVLQQLKVMGEAPGGLFMIDRQLSQRVFSMPAAATA